MAKSNTEAKIAAAQDAVDKAAALLLEHAEGLAMLARWPTGGIATPA